MAEKHINIDLDLKLRFDAFIADLQKKDKKTYTQRNAFQELLAIGEKFLRGELVAATKGITKEVGI